MTLNRPRDHAGTRDVRVMSQCPVCGRKPRMVAHSTAKDGTRISFYIHEWQHRVVGGMRMLTLPPVIEESCEVREVAVINAAS